MTLDEAIQILERKADKCLKLIKQLEEDDSISAVMHSENESQRYEEYRQLAEWLKELKEHREKQEWIPCSERMPEHSYTKRFWLTVKLDDDENTVTTLIGTWGAWGGGKGSKPYDAFDCWKDVMINGGIYRMSQPISKEKVLAWMPLPEPYEGSR